MTWRPVVWLVAVSLAGVACSSSGSPSTDGGARASTTEPSTASTEVTSPASDDQTPASDDPAAEGDQASPEPGPAPEAGASGSARAAPDPAPEDLPPLKTEVTLAEECVRPGGTQTITVNTGEPGSGVVYDTVYSNGKTGLDESHYGGNHGGHTDDTGTWTDRWVVGPEAPAGEARVDVLTTSADGRTGAARAAFIVADALGRCS